MRWLNRIELLHCSKYVSTTGILMPYICRWMSPESLLSRRFTTKSDVYSFGILLWEMYSDFLEPYCGHTNQEVRTLATSQSTVQPSRIKCIYHVTTAVIKNTKMQKSHFDLMRTQDWDRFFHWVAELEIRQKLTLLPQARVRFQLYTPILGALNITRFLSLFSGSWHDNTRRTPLVSGSVSS